jgi:hypothetical protein
MLIVDNDRDLKTVWLELGSFAIELQLSRYGGRDYLRIGKFRKWNQDGKFHPDHTLSVLDSDMREKILPALAELYGKQLV